MTVDYHNKPLCSDAYPDEPAPGEWPAASPTRRLRQIDDLGPGDVLHRRAPAGLDPCNSGNPDSQWYQTTTIDGGLQLQAGVEEGSDGTGAPGEQLWEPPDRPHRLLVRLRLRAARRFAQPGHRRDHRHGPQLAGLAAVRRPHLGRARSQNPFVALTDSTTDQTVYVGQGDADGNFDIQNVPAGTYNLSIWDEQLSYIIRFLPVTVTAGAVVDVNETDVKVRRRRRVALVRLARRRRLQGRERQREVTDRRRARASANTDVDQRWRDGSIKEGTFTDTDGYYEYPTAEGGALGKWIINEQGFARFGVTGRRRCTTSYDPSRLVDAHVPDRPGRRPAHQPAAHRGPPGDGRLGQARLPRRHARPDRRHHLLRDDPQRVRRAVPGARGLRAGHPRRRRCCLEGLGPGRHAEHRRRRRAERVRHRPLAAPDATQPPDARLQPGVRPSRDAQGNDISGSSTR